MFQTTNEPMVSHLENDLSIHQLVCPAHNDTFNS